MQSSGIPILHRALRTLPKTNSNGDARTFEAFLKRLNGDAGTSALGKWKPAAKRAKFPRPSILNLQLTD
jgi:hypothetical protein